MPNNSNVRPVPPLAVKAMLSDGQELALIDLREELTFSQRHLLWARSVPLSRLELRFARLVPRRREADTTSPKALPAAANPIPLPKRPLL